VLREEPQTRRSVLAGIGALFAAAILPDMSVSTSQLNAEIAARKAGDVANAALIAALTLRVTALEKPVLPGAPTNLRATPGDHTVTLSWT
jgi:hypothetical protein